MEPGARTLIEEAHQCLDRTLTWRSQLGAAANRKLLHNFAQTYYGPAHVDQAVETWLAMEQPMWDTASTTVLTPEIADLLRQAAETMPEAPVLAEIVPSPTGVVIMPNDDMILDYNNPVDAAAGATVMPVHAIAWQVIPNIGSPDRVTGQVSHLPGVVLWLYSSTTAAAWSDYTMPEDIRRGGFIYLDLLPWAFNTGWKSREAMAVVEDPENGRIRSSKAGQDHFEFDGDAMLTDPHVAFVRRFMLTLWTFLADDIIRTSTERLPRPLERRAKRTGPTELRIAHLRRVRYIDEAGVEHEPGSREYSHRFLVRGHWRHLASGRVTWVRPHIRGPQDKPFVMKHDIDMVRR